MTGWLVYDNSKPKAAPVKIYEFTPFDDWMLEPYDGLELFDHVDHSITLDMKMANLGNGAN